MEVSNNAKTVVLGNDRKSFTVSHGVCPLCNAKLQLAEDTDKVICPICGYTKLKVVDFQPGSILKEKYRLLSSLNSGGCGDIFLCHPLNDVSTRYVVKIMKNNHCPDMQQRFMREANILQLMEDERIVHLFDYWTDSSGSFIILEYVDGKNLRDLRQDFIFEEESTLLIVREVALALQYALDNFSVIHRDIKPENIMLDQDNHIKLLDFGLSKDTAEVQANITMEHAGLGTPGFMSPEQFIDFKHSDFRSDIFSIGATMFLLLTGEPPFKGTDPQEIYNNTIANAPPPAEKLLPYCSNDCAELIRWMMQKESARRPSSYAELIQAIDRLLGE